MILILVFTPHIFLIAAFLCQIFSNNASHVGNWATDMGSRAADMGSPTDRGWVLSILAMFSGAFMGNSRETWSGNEKPSIQNNPVLAVEANLLSGGGDAPDDFTGMLWNGI